MLPRGPWGVPGGPWGSRGGSWGFSEGSGQSLGCLGGPGGALGGPQEFRGGVPGVPQGSPQGASLDASVGAMGALKNDGKPLVFIKFPALGGSGRFLRGSLVGPWGCLGVPGRP